jgi:hypothetical protein
MIPKHPILNLIQEILINLITIKDKHLNNKNHLHKKFPLDKELCKRELNKYLIFQNINECNLIYI